MVKSQLTFPRYYFRDFLGVSLAAYVVALVYVNILLLLHSQDKIPSGLFFLGLAAAAPLLAVSPIGARIFYISFVCLLMSGVCILKKYAEELHFNKKIAAARVLFRCAVCLTY